MSDRGEWIAPCPTGEQARRVTPLNIPGGAHISFIFEFYKDSNPTHDIDLSFARTNTWDGSGHELQTASGGGSHPGIRRPAGRSELSAGVVFVEMGGIHLR